MELSDRTKGIIGRVLLFSATIVWGSSFVLLKNAVTEIGGGNFTFFVLAIRFLLSAIIISLISIKSVIKTSKKTFKKGAMLGVVLFIAYAMQTVGLKYTSASKNAFLTATYCVLIPFFAWFILKRKPKIKNYISTVMCIIGIDFVAIIGKEEFTLSTELFGDILSVLSGVFYALQIVYISKFHEEGENPIQLLVTELFITALLCLFCTFAFEFPTHYEEFTFPTSSIWNVLYLTLFATCYTQFAQMYGQRYTPPVKVSLILTLEAVFGVLFEIILGESRITVYIAIGFIVIFFTEFMSEFGFDYIASRFEEIKRRKKDKEQP